MNTKEKIEVMQAWEDGKIIQSSSGRTWHDCIVEPTWQWGDLMCRTKPEPKEIWVNEYEEGVRIAVKYREVIDDES